MPTCFLTRVRLRRDANVAALARVLLPQDEGAKTVAAHSLIWSLFAGDREAKRDFLYREEGRTRGGRFTILSQRRPHDDIGLFEMDEAKEFAPALRAGEKLCFALRVNPTIDRRESNRSRSVRSDVIMHQLKAVKHGERSLLRDSTAREATLAWLKAQGLRSGFVLDDVEQSFRVDGYDQVRLPRDKGKPILFSRIDIEGLLIVTDPSSFVSKVIKGFGKAKAFGCGLMLIRRARR